MLQEQVSRAINIATTRLDETTRLFHDLIGGASDELERRIDGASERFFGQIETSISSATGSIDQANKTFQEVIGGTAGIVVKSARNLEGRDRRRGRNQRRRGAGPHRRPPPMPSRPSSAAQRTISKARSTAQPSASMAT